ncbi:OadG family protein [Peptoniphilus raoultii]|nr:OadG family protein [Peptoniphilus raoultii]
MDLSIMEKGFEISILGMSGVFLVLILFYISTKIMLKIFSKK